VEFNKEDYAPEFDWEQACPICQKEMVVRHGRFGAFLGCSTYPDCRGTVNIPRKGEELLSSDEMPECPAKGCSGKLCARRSRYGKIFYSCSTYPDCDVIVNNLDDLKEKYVDHPRTAYVKKERAKRSKASKPSKKKSPSSTRKLPTFKLSPPLAALVDSTEMTRGEVTKALWAYIKTHELQDPQNKRLICPDQKLAALFGSADPVDMFQLSKLISKHLSKK
jgi:DNA topoisomerase-1